MNFLNEVNIIGALKERIQNSRRVRIAVAFWGDGAVEQLGLLQSNARIEIICNLRTGGTNPSEIGKLLKPNTNIRVEQCDKLHGKVYLFDDDCVIGSSNASANGLSMEGAEIKGWHEAIFCDDPNILGETSRWFNDLPTRAIEERDLRDAQQARSRRRRENPSPSYPDGSTLIDALRTNIASFRDRRIYLCAYSEWLRGAAEDMLKQAQSSISEKAVRSTVGCFEWDDLPDAADLVCFYVGPDGGVQFDDFWETPSTAWVIRGNRTSIKLCYRKKKINGISKPGPTKQWAAGLRQFKQNWREQEPGDVIDLSAFAEKYLFQAGA